MWKLPQMSLQVLGVHRNLSARLSLWPFPPSSLLLFLFKCLFIHVSGFVLKNMSERAKLWALRACTEALF